MLEIPFIAFFLTIFRIQSPVSVESSLDNNLQDKASFVGFSDIMEVVNDPLRVNLSLKKAPWSSPRRLALL